MHSVCSWTWVESEVARSAESWHACAVRPLPCGPSYTSFEQQVREQAWDRATHEVERELRSPPRTRADRFATRERILSSFAQFAGVALDFEEEAVHLITHGFLPAGAEFARSSRRFDAGLSMAEIVQACRNAWTVYGLQPLLNQPAAITPSIVGYSLLYPYTDNYLDRIDTSATAKRRFCARFRQRLRGDRLPPDNPHETSIWALVAMIEGQYPRARFPQVFDALLSIHRAQEESVAQLRFDRSLSASEILNISFAKGGASVLADACLAGGWLNQQQGQVAFDWGALLQLGDDLQDVREDLRRGSATLFTLAAAQRVPLDSLVIQLLNFSEIVAGNLNRLPDGTATLKNLLRMSWRSLVVAAVANASEFFSPAFLSELQRSSPFRFRFLQARHRKLTEGAGLYSAVFNAMLAEPDFEQPPAGDPFLRPAPLPVLQN